MIREDISRLRKNRITHFKIGLICSLSFVIFAFNYTVEPYSDELVIEEVAKEIIEIQTIRTPREKKPLPPPPKLEINDLIIEDESPEFIEDPEPEPIPEEVPVEIVKEPIVKTKAPKPKPKPVLKPIKEEEPIVDDIPFRIVEDMPEFGNCGVSKDKKERRMNSDRNVLKFINSKIKYPRIALENGIEGTVFVKFVIDRAGQVTDLEIVRTPQGGKMLGEEVLRVMRMMPNWKAGKQRFKPVKVQYTIPVKFNPI